MGVKSSKWLKDVDLSKDVDIKTAERIWATYDVNHDGFLDKAEAKKFIEEWCLHHGITNAELHFRKFWAKFELREELKISKEDLFGEYHSSAISPANSPGTSPASSPKQHHRGLSWGRKRASTSTQSPTTTTPGRNTSPSTATSFKAEEELLRLVAASGDASTRRAKADANYRAALISKLTHFTEQVNSADRNGSSILDIQKGIFTLLQGAAYRTYIIKFAVEPVTESPDRSLPYTFAHFTKFVRAVIQLYKSLDVVDEACQIELDGLVQCVEKQEQAIRKQVAEWTAEKQKLWEESELALTQNPRNHALSVEKKHSKEDVETFKHFLNKAQQNTRNMFSEGFSHVVHAPQPKSFLDHQFRVLLDSTADETLPGCVCPVRFWYEIFMPKLLSVCSIQRSSDLTLPTETQLDLWMQTQVKEKKFSHYGKDLEENWSKCDVNTKTSLSRAWRLMVFYLNGIQKQRERVHSGGHWGPDSRAGGDLSHYVAFIDVYLGKSYVQAAAMRLSFPYLIGPNTWVWHHTVAERAVQLDAKSENVEKVANIVDNFKVYMLEFLHNYPCPYCRHHLNVAVIRGTERTLYPLEYLFIGWEPTPQNLRGEVEAAQKLAYITDARTLSLFVWKLHNAVSSSISREEEWYQSEVEVVYTSRYWPNIDAELYRGATHSGLVAANRIRLIMDVLKTAKELTGLRDAILNVRPEELETLMLRARSLVTVLDRKILMSGFLQETYAYQPGLVDPEPDAAASVTAGELARHEDFTLS